MVANILKEEGYQKLKTANTVNEALSICKEWKPDFAVLDIMLPDGDGIEFYKYIKQKYNIPIIFFAFSTAAAPLISRDMYTPMG